MGELARRRGGARRRGCLKSNAADAPARPGHESRNACGGGGGRGAASAERFSGEVPALPGSGGDQVDGARRWREEAFAPVPPGRIAHGAMVVMTGLSLLGLPILPRGASVAASSAARPPPKRGSAGRGRDSSETSSASAMVCRSEATAKSRCDVREPAARSTSLTPVPVPVCVLGYDYRITENKNFTDWTLVPPSAKSALSGGGGRGVRENPCGRRARRPHSARRDGRDVHGRASRERARPPAKAGHLEPYGSTLWCRGRSADSFRAPTEKTSREQGLKKRTRATTALRLAGAPTRPWRTTA